jgi:hypothetical protein
MPPSVFVFDHDSPEPGTSVALMRVESARTLICALGSAPFDVVLIDLIQSIIGNHFRE